MEGSPTGSPTHSEEIHRFQFQELDAERRYIEAIESMDNAAAVIAAQDWKSACEALDALLEYPTVAHEKAVAETPTN